MKSNQLTSLKIGLAIFIFHLHGPCHSQPTTPLGAESHALSSIRLGAQNTWAAYNNPCDMHADTILRIGLSTQRPYGISDLKSATLCAIFNGKQAAFGGYYNYLGYSVSNNTLAGFSASKNLSKMLSLGIGIGLISHHVRAEQRTRQISISLSGKHEIQHNKTLYFLIENGLPSSTAVSTFVNSYAGISFQLNAKLTWLNQLHVSPETRAGLQSGIRYKLKQHFVLLIGINTLPASISFGCILTLSKININLAFRSHQVLGFTPAISSEWLKV